MITWLALMALLIVVVFFLVLGRRDKSFRQRNRQRRQVFSAEQPPNPDFQFDRPQPDGNRESDAH